MNILYISTSCSPRKYQEVYEMRTVKAIEPQQKFNALLIEGISKQSDVKVTALSALPVSASTCSVKYFQYEEECISGSLTYQYIPFRNGRMTRVYDTYVNTRKYLKKWIISTAGEDRYIIADALSLFMTSGCFDLARKYKIPFIGIVTDLPELSTNMKSRNESFFKKTALDLFQKALTKSLAKYCAYITLTESLYEAVDIKQVKPHIIVEGSTDSTIEYNEKSKKHKAVVYAGGVYEKYGVKNLVEAFASIDTDIELHIYGDGTYASKITDISKTHPNIIYKGVVSLEDIVRIEEESLLLVNPRPSNEEFSKYSFPSKTLEYMASGTPLLSTKLPGIPIDYFNYIYTFEDESDMGFVRSLFNVLKKDTQELRDKGRQAFEFVSREKTNIKQGKRIVEFLKKLKCYE